METSTKQCSRILMQRMAENYATRTLNADDFRAAFDSLFFSAVRAAREADALRQFDRYKETEAKFSRLLASVYLNGMTDGAELQRQMLAAEMPPATEKELAENRCDAAGVSVAETISGEQGF